MTTHTSYRRTPLYVALFLATSLLIVDRTAAYIHRPGPASKEVTIYTAQWCPFCRKLRALLDNHEIPYTEHDVEHSLQGSLGFWALRGTGVPVSVIGPDIIYGFDVGKIETSLAGLGYPVSSVQQSKAQTGRKSEAPSTE